MMFESIPHPELSMEMLLLDFISYFIAMDIHQSLQLDEITGEITTDNLLENLPIVARDVSLTRIMH